MRLFNVLILSALLFFPSLSFATLAIDGSATGTTVSGSTIAATLTTSNANDIIYIFTKAATASNASNVSSISSTSGLTFTKRESQTPPTNAVSGMDAWSAVASSPLTSEVITVTFSPTPTSGRVTAFGISGANTGTPGDSNGSIPAQTYTFSNVQTLNRVLSTNNANTILVAQLTAGNALGTLTRPGGFSQIIATGTFTDISYSIVSSTLSSVTETFSWTGTAAPAGIQMDAIVAASAGGGQKNNPLWFGQW